MCAFFKGVGMLYTWNVLITAVDYFTQRFRGEKIQNGSKLANSAFFVSLYHSILFCTVNFIILLCYNRSN